MQSCEHLGFQAEHAGFLWCPVQSLKIFNQTSRYEERRAELLEKPPDSAILSCWTLGKSHSSLGLNFLLCEMKLLTVPTTQDYVVRQCKAWLGNCVANLVPTLSLGYHWDICGEVETAGKKLFQKQKDLQMQGSKSLATLEWPRREAETSLDCKEATDVQGHVAQIPPSVHGDKNQVLTTHKHLPAIPWPPPRGGPLSRPGWSHLYQSSALI